MPRTRRRQAGRVRNGADALVDCINRLADLLHLLRIAVFSGSRRSAAPPRAPSQADPSGRGPTRRSTASVPPRHARSVVKACELFLHVKDCLVNPAAALGLADGQQSVQLLSQLSDLCRCRCFPGARWAARYSEESRARRTRHAAAWPCRQRHRPQAKTFLARDYCAPRCHSRLSPAGCSTRRASRAQRLLAQLIQANRVPRTRSNPPSRRALHAASRCTC